MRQHIIRESVLTYVRKPIWEVGLPKLETSISLHALSVLAIIPFSNPIISSYKFTLVIF